MHRGFPAGFDVAQGHHLLGKQANRPTVTPRGRITAGQSDQMCLGRSVQPPDFPGALIAVLQYALKAAIHQTPTKPLSRPRSGVKRFRDFRVRPTRILGPLVEFQKHPGVVSLVSCHSLGLDDPCELGTFFCCQFDDVLLHGRPPCRVKGSINPIGTKTIYTLLLGHSSRCKRRCKRGCKAMSGTDVKPQVTGLQTLRPVPRREYLRSRWLCRAPAGQRPAHLRRSSGLYWSAGSVARME